MAVLPFNEVAQKVKRVDSLLFVLIEWEPTEPMGKNLIDIDALWPKPHDLSNSRDAVFCGIDILFGA